MTHPAAEARVRVSLLTVVRRIILGWDDFFLFHLDGPTLLEIAPPPFFGPFPLSFIFRVCVFNNLWFQNTVLKLLFFQRLKTEGKAVPALGRFPGVTELE